MVQQVARAAGGGEARDAEDAHRDGLVLGDEARLRQVIANLVTNAITHTPEGTVVTLHLRPDAEDRAIIEVSDDGPGVPREEHENLFRRLYRREASGSQPGYGLGLSLALAIAELHGAAIRVLEAAGPGLTVEIAFVLLPDKEMP